MNESEQKLEQKWVKNISKKLVGKTISKVRYMSEDEQEHYGWSHRPVILILNDGYVLFPSSDDEGNEGGALFTTYKNLETIPVL